MVRKYWARMCRMMAERCMGRCWSGMCEMMRCMMRVVQIEWSMVMLGACKMKEYSVLMTKGYMMRLVQVELIMVMVGALEVMMMCKKTAEKCMKLRGAR